MEFCHSLRNLFIKDDKKSLSISELQLIINSKLDKEYSPEQIIIGMDYAGFTKVDDCYCVVEDSESVTMQGE